MVIDFWDFYIILGQRNFPQCKLLLMDKKKKV